MEKEVYVFTKVVLVENLSYNVSKEDLIRFFENCGTITNIRIVHDKNNRPKGNAFIAFENHDMALEALSKDEKRFFDRYIYVELNQSSKIEEELTVKEEQPKFSPMLGKPHSENPLILEAYETLINKLENQKKKFEEKDEKKSKEKVEQINQETNKERKKKKKKTKSEKVKSKHKLKKEDDHHHRHKIHERKNSEDRHRHYHHRNKKRRHCHKYSSDST